MFHGKFNGFLMFELWFCIRYIVLNSIHLSLYLQLQGLFSLSWCFMHDFGIVLPDQIFHNGVENAPNFLGIFVKILTEFVVLWKEKIFLSDIYYQNEEIGHLKIIFTTFSSGMSSSYINSVLQGSLLTWIYRFKLPAIP